MSGFDPPEPERSPVYDKFLNRLRAAGINVKRQGTRLNLMALTNADVKELAGDRVLQNAETIDWKTYQPVKGGLFDQSLTGGFGGNRWAVLPLREPMPSPVMEEPIRKVLGLTQDKFRNVLAGREKLNDLTGPEAIFKSLARIDLDKQIELEKSQIKYGSQSQRDNAIKRLNFLAGSKKTGRHPKDWMLAGVPVLPPMFRPISKLGSSGIPLVGDSNLVYKELFEANQVLQDLKDKVDDVGDERLAVYDARHNDPLEESVMGRLGVPCVPSIGVSGSFVADRFVEAWAGHLHIAVELDTLGGEPVLPVDSR
jgi:hypothetical protein